METITRLTDAQAQGAVAETFAAVKAKFGAVPDMFRALANSPAALGGYFAFSGALAKGTLGAATAEAIALASAARHGCDFCAAAHGQLAKGAGLTAADIVSARKGQAQNARIQAALDLAAVLWAGQGKDADTAVAAAKSKGLSDGDIAEIAGHVALNIFTNFFNNLAHIEPPAAWRAAA
jgi:uncharacterized peroxidase-related enzyme